MDVSGLTQYLRLTENSWKCWYYGNKMKLRGFGDIPFMGESLSGVPLFKRSELLWTMLMFVHLIQDQYSNSLGKLLKRREARNMLHYNIVSFQISLL